MSWSVEPGKARVVMANQHDQLSTIHHRLSDPSVLTVAHNWLYDASVLDRMGVRPSRVADTMVMAYLLATEPQGLKPLAYRNCGMTMESYEDTVGDATKRKALAYLCEVLSRSWPKITPIEVWEKDKRRTKQPQAIYKRVWRIVKDSIEKGADPYDRWRNIDLDAGRGMVETVLGPMPIGDLSDVDHSAAIHYAARDADATLRLYHALWPRIEADGLADVFWADMEAMPIIAEMMKVGVRVDRAHFAELSVYLADKAEECRQGILATIRASGTDLSDFNPNSWQQVAEVLYTRMGIRHPKGLETTDNATLATLVEGGRISEDQKAVIKGIQDYRSYIKLKGTYADAIPVLADSHDRVHTTFKTTRTATGRLCVDPDTLIEMPRDMDKYPDGVPLREVQAGDWVYSFDWERELCVKKVKWVGPTKTAKTVVLRYAAKDGPELQLKLSPDHLVRLLSGGWIPAGRLKPGDRLMCMVKRTQHGQGYYCIFPHSKNRGNGTGSGGRNKEHRFVYSQVYSDGRHLGKALVHHKDRRKSNNTPSNLAWLKSQSDHAKEHRYSVDEYTEALRTGVSRKGEPLKASTLQVYRRRLHRMLLTQVGPSNHYVISVEPGPEMQLWDLEVEDTHCFIGNEVALHNSSSNPNLQNQPVRGEEAKKLRDGFIASDGCILVECDYSQIELRVLAHGSQDQRMVQIFRDGVDLHTQTAATAYGIPLDQVDSVQRRASKTVNFGIPYGMSAGGLQAALATMGIQWTENRCEDFIGRYFATFPGVKAFMTATHDHAKRFGYVLDMFGRRRYIPNARSQNKGLREAALREAQNFPIQSGAQGIIKRAMGRRLRDLVMTWRKAGVVVNALVQVHDSLLFEVSKEAVGWMVPLIIDVMASAVELSVPVLVDAKVGRNWGTMEKMIMEEAA
jgi:DNA polymerase I-like protein with 3'-5' exonuclease and polymerase domains